MLTAREVREAAARGEGCLGKAADDEPVFVLRGRDLLAPDLVEKWAIDANAVKCPWDKVREAKEIAQLMREWPGRKNPD
jgi:hypothetical protein